MLFLPKGELFVVINNIRESYMMGDTNDFNEFINDCIYIVSLFNKSKKDYEDIERFEYVEDNKVIYTITMEELERNYFRICTECGSIMTEGFCIENGMEYYCSEECLHKNISEEEYLELYDDGNGDTYWTQWR